MSHLQALVVAAAAFTAAPAHADDAGVNARCRRARAAADASVALLHAPSIGVQLAHLPGAGDPDLDANLRGEGYVARGILSFDAIDLFRADRVDDAAAAECAAERAADKIVTMLEHAEDYGQRTALEAEADALAGQLARIDELLDASAQRRERQIDTAVEDDDLVIRALHVRRSIADARHEIAVLAAHGADDAPIDGAAAQLERYAASLGKQERAESSLRRLAGWNLDLQLGVVPEDGVEWYGMISLTVDLGVIRQTSAERRYRDARADELDVDPRELRGRVDAFREAMAASAAALGDELALVERQLAVITEERARLAERGAERWQHQDAALELDAIELDARRIYLSRLIATRAQAAEVVP